MFIVKNLVFVFIALVLGVVGLSLVFSDPGSGESTLTHIFIAAIFFFLCGMGIGYFNPQAWIISALSSWGGFVFGSVLVIAAIRRYGAGAFAAQQPPYLSSGLAILVVPLGLAVLGGYVGKSLRRNASGKL